MSKNNKNNLKSFFIKVVAITFSIIVIINVTYNLIFAQQFENLNKALSLNNKESIEMIKDKMRAEINKGLLKDNYIWENINNLKIPCLIIRAHKSTALPLSSIKKIKKKNKSIKIETMTNASHLFPFEQPEIVTKKINNFI